MPNGLLEEFVGALNANLSLREFAFSAAQLRIPGRGTSSLQIT
jgi:hypothetical protein